MTLVALSLLSVFATIAAVRERVLRRRVNARIRELQDKLVSQWDYAQSACDTLRAERDRAVTERDAALDGPKYRPMTLREIADLAKTGCSACHGAGHFSTKGGEAVCECVRRRMNEDRKYGWSGHIPVQLASAAELAAASGIASA